MSPGRITWAKALRAAFLAVVLVVLTLFAIANFVLVDVSVFGITVRTRLAWIVLVPSVLAFGCGLLYARLRRMDA